MRPNGFDPPTLGFEKDRAISRRNRRAKIVKNIYKSNKWCARTDCSRLRRSSSASLRTAAAARRRPTRRSAGLSNRSCLSVGGSNCLFPAGWPGLPKYFL
jgi:hypothetical protein